MRHGPCPHFIFSIISHPKRPNYWSIYDPTFPTWPGPPSTESCNAGIQMRYSFLQTIEICRAILRSKRACVLESVEWKGEMRGEKVYKELHGVSGFEEQIQQTLQSTYTIHPPLAALIIFVHSFHLQSFHYWSLPFPIMRFFKSLAAATLLASSVHAAPTSGPSDIDILQYALTVSFSR